MTALKRPAHVAKADKATDRLVVRMVASLRREDDARRRERLDPLPEDRRHLHAKVVDYARLQHRKSVRRAHGRTAAR